MIAQNVEYFESTKIFCQNSLHLHCIYNACFPSIKLTALLTEVLHFSLKKCIVVGGVPEGIPKGLCYGFENQWRNSKMIHLLFIISSYLHIVILFSIRCLKARVKWIMLKIVWHNLLQQREKKGRQSLDKFLLRGEKQNKTTKHHRNFKELSLNFSCQKCNTDKADISICTALLETAGCFIKSLIISVLAPAKTDAM